jgi:hypothetical protein
MKNFTSQALADPAAAGFTTNEMAQEVRREGEEAIGIPAAPSQWPAISLIDEFQTVLSQRYGSSFRNEILFAFFAYVFPLALAHSPRAQEADPVSFSPEQWDRGQMRMYLRTVTEAADRAKMNAAAAALFFRAVGAANLTANDLSAGLDTLLIRAVENNVTPAARSEALLRFFYGKWQNSKLALVGWDYSWPKELGAKDTARSLRNQDTVLARGVDFLSRTVVAIRVLTVLRRRGKSLSKTVGEVCEAAKVQRKVLRKLLRWSFEANEAFKVWETVIPTAGSSRLPFKSRSSLDKEQLIAKGRRIVERRLNAPVKVPITFETIAAELGETPALVMRAAALKKMIEANFIDEDDARMMNAIIRLAASDLRPHGEMKTNQLATLIREDYMFLVARAEAYSPPLKSIVELATAGKWAELAGQAPVSPPANKVLGKEIILLRKTLVENGRYSTLHRITQIPIAKIRAFALGEIPLTLEERGELTHALADMNTEESPAPENRSALEGSV